MLNETKEIQEFANEWNDRELARAAAIVSVDGVPRMPVEFAAYALGVKELPVNVKSWLR